MREWMWSVCFAVVMAGCAGDPLDTDSTSVAPDEVPYCSDDADCCTDGLVGTCYSDNIEGTGKFCWGPGDPEAVCHVLGGPNAHWVPCCSTGDPPPGGGSCDDCHWGGPGTCDDPWEDQLCDEVCLMQCSRGGHCSGGDSCCCEGPDYN